LSFTRKGDGSARRNLDNRVSRNPTDLGRIYPMLEWRPRLIALLVVVVLVASVLVTGYFGDLLLVDNWEW
jgi:hypothetical protein